MNLLIADSGLQIADCVLHHGSWPVSRSERNTELSMNRPRRGRQWPMSNEQSESPRILHIAHCTLLIAHCSLLFDSEGRHVSFVHLKFHRHLAQPADDRYDLAQVWIEVVLEQRRARCL